MFYAVKANPGAGGAEAPRRARLVLRHAPRWPRSSWRSPPARRPTASPSATRSRRSATSRALSSSACACSRSIARPRSRRSPARRSGGCRRTSRCSAASCATAPAPNGRCRASSAACPRWPIDVLEHAHRLGLEAYGVSFHVGSQQGNTEAWDQALASASAIFRECAERGIHLSMVNLGGGFPTKYLKDVPAVEGLWRVDLPGALASTSATASRRRSSSRAAAWSAMPASSRPRSCSSRRRAQDEDEVRWVYLDIGKFGGLAETMDESIRYPIRTRARRRPQGRPACSPARPAIRPTCSTRRRRIRCPISLEIGDKVLIEGTGAYTTTYSAVAFNGFPPLKSYVI